MKEASSAKDTVDGGNLALLEIPDVLFLRCKVYLRPNKFQFSDSL